MKKAIKGYDLTISMNKFELSYDDVGKGDIPIIFLHGYPFDKTMWQNQVDYFTSSHRLILCDIRGFGKSKDEESALSIDLFTADLIEFMDKLIIEKAILCGLSMGGFIALNAIKNNPDRFEALILCDTQCISDCSEVKEKRYNSIADIEENGVLSFNEEFITSVFHKKSILNKNRLVSQLRSVVFSNSCHIIKQGLTAIAKRSETCSILEDIQIPTLILCGREDEVTPLEQSEYLNVNIKNSELHIIDDAGHISNLEQPEAFNQHLYYFLSKLPGGKNFEKINGENRMV